MRIITLLLPFLFLSCAEGFRIFPECSSRFSETVFLEEADRFRKEHELEPLARDAFLSGQALLWAEYNGKKEAIVHYDAEGNGPLERLKKAGFKKRLIAQNIATFPLIATPHMVIDSWKEKKEQENLVNPVYRSAGYGIASFKNGCVLVLILTE